MSGYGASSTVRRLVSPERRGIEASLQSTVRDLLLHGGLNLADAEVRLASPAHNRPNGERLRALFTGSSRRRWCASGQSAGMHTTWRIRAR